MEYTLLKVDHTILNALTCFLCAPSIILNDPYPASPVSSVTPVLKPTFSPAPSALVLDQSQCAKWTEGKRFHYPQPTSGKVIRDKRSRVEEPAENDNSIRNPPQPPWRVCQGEPRQNHSLEDVFYNNCHALHEEEQKRTRQRTRVTNLGVAAGGMNKTAHGESHESVNDRLDS